MAPDAERDLPVEMISFVLRHGDFSKAGFRLGQLALRFRPPIRTPTYIASASRGTIPHVTPDVLSKLTAVPALYIALEDFVEKTPSNAPILRSQPTIPSSRLRDFVSLPKNCISILGPRRVPPLECPKQNSNSALAISTSVGFQSLDVDEYIRCMQELQPDIAISPADVVLGQEVSQKRIEKSADRSHAWLQDMLTARVEAGSDASPLFASIPPLEPEQQSFYLSDLGDEYKADIGGVTLSSWETAASLPQELERFPRLCLTNPESPHDLLRAVALGNDMITVPFVTAASENGLAWSFSLSPSVDMVNEPVGLDLWSPSHATDTGPLVEGCACYTCTKHHRAYLHHLLSAKEMLAWTLLQIHNFHIIDQFFEQIRVGIAEGTFETLSKTFSKAYDSNVPQFLGLGPRIRGYQVKSVGKGEPKKNKKAYGRLDEHVLKLEEAVSGVATPEEETKAEDLEKQGLGTVQNA